MRAARYRTVIIYPSMPWRYPAINILVSTLSFNQTPVSKGKWATSIAKMTFIFFPEGNIWLPGWNGDEMYIRFESNPGNKALFHYVAPAQRTRTSCSCPVQLIPKFFLTVNIEKIRTKSLCSRSKKVLICIMMCVGMHSECNKVKTP